MGNDPAIFLKDLDLIRKVEVTDHEYFYDFGKILLLVTKNIVLLLLKDSWFMMIMQKTNLVLLIQRVKHGKE